MATKKSVLWSKETFSPLDLKTKFNDQFPIIVMVASGYYGQTEIGTVSSDQVLIVQGWSSQKRVFAKDNKGRFLSIPSDYPLKFEVTSKTEQDLYLRPVSARAQPLWKIAETHGLPIRVQFDRQVSSCFYVGANPRCTETFGHLELIAVYDENYLKANTINAGKIDSEAITVIPMYMQTQFVIAEGLKGTPVNLWENMRQHYIRRVQHLDFEHANGNMDIMLYDSHVVKTGRRDYDLVMPKSYVRHPSIGAISGAFTSEGTIKPAPKAAPRFYPLKSRPQSTSAATTATPQPLESHDHKPQPLTPKHHEPPPKMIIHGDRDYTTLTHASPKRAPQHVSQPSCSSHHGMSYHQQGTGDYPHMSPPLEHAPPVPTLKGGLTAEDQGQLVKALRKLSVTRQARVSDSSTDSSTTSSDSTTSNSEQSSTSPVKLNSPQHQVSHESETNISDDAASGNGNSIHGSGFVGSATCVVEPTYVQPISCQPTYMEVTALAEPSYVQVHFGNPNTTSTRPPRGGSSHSDSSSQVAASAHQQHRTEEAMSSDDSIDALNKQQNNMYATVNKQNKGGKISPPFQSLLRRSHSDQSDDSTSMINDTLNNQNNTTYAVVNKANKKRSGSPPFQPLLRRNQSESDAPRDVHWVYGGLIDTQRGTYSCSGVDNGYFCYSLGTAQTSHRPLHALLANQTFKSLEDIPNDISTLTVEDVGDCLRLLNLGMYVRKFADYQVDGALLKTFTHDDFNKEFGVSSVIAKKLEQFAKHGWRPRHNFSPRNSPKKVKH